MNNGAAVQLVLMDGSKVSGCICIIIYQSYNTEVQAGGPSLKNGENKSGAAVMFFVSVSGR